MSTLLKLNKPEFDSLYKADPSFNILNFDFLNKNAVAKLALPKEQEPKLLDELKSYQRLLRIDPNMQVADSLYENGINSAGKIANVPFKKFFKEYGDKLGITKDTAQNIYARATDIHNKSMHLWASVQGSVAPSLYASSTLNNVSDEVKTTFQNLPSYQDMFGSLDYCYCEDCKSIFSPAAYLVDLLRIVDEYITEPNKNTIPKEFLFSSRRADIGNMALTCGNTNDLLPYLEIVNERLVAYVQNDSGVKTADEVLKSLAVTYKYPFDLPFNIPLNQISILLQSLKLEYSAILQAWKKDQNVVSSIGLNLSNEQSKIITTVIDTADGIKPFFNVDTIDSLNDVDTFLSKTWLSFGELLTLINQNLSDEEQEAGLQSNFFINKGLDAKYISIDDSKLTNLGVSQLDQINRIKRLSICTNYQVEEIDWALRSCKGGETPVIDNDSLVKLYQLFQVLGQLDLQLYETMALVGPIKTYGEGIVKEGTQFDNLFNTASIVAKQGYYRPSGNSLNSLYKDTPLKWTPLLTTDDNTSAINRVLPGLGISLEDINTLGSFLYGSVEKELTVETLSELYRHSLLSKKFKMSIKQYIIFVDFVGLVKKESPTLTEIFNFIQSYKVLDGMGLKIYDLDYIINNDLNLYVDPYYSKDNIEKWLLSLQKIVTGDDPEEELCTQIALYFNCDNSLAKVLIDISIKTEDLPAGVQTWDEAFLTLDEKGKPKYEAYVSNILNWISRWLVLQIKLNISLEQMQNISSYPSVYNLPDNFNQISWSCVQAVDNINQTMLKNSDEQKNLLVCIQLFFDNAPLSEQLETLNKVTNWSVSEANTLLTTTLSTEKEFIQRLDGLKECFSIIDTLGTNVTFIDSLSGLVELDENTNWGKYNSVCNELLSKTAAVFTTQWDSVWKDISGKLQEKKRDVLLSLVLVLLNSKFPTIKTSRNVYEYMLTNIDIGSESQISYIKEALNSIQTYLNRCRLQLEPGVTDLSYIHDEWWEWMMNYRVWEANREIFLYPENYLIPSLRKNTTPEFADLMQTLKQSDVKKEYVGEAFTSYINSFNQISSMEVLDVYNTKIDGLDNIFLLGRTKIEPYIYYYCYQKENMPWSAWEKIDITIDSKNATLVYAFNRLFIFWNKIQSDNTSSVSGENGNVETKSSETIKLSISYSFINEQGKWVHPQELISDKVIYFDSEDSRDVKLKNEPIFKNLFDTSSPSWNKVYLFKIDSKNYVDDVVNDMESERLVVMYGPNVYSSNITIDPQSTAPSKDINSKSFWTNLHDRIGNDNRVILSQTSGNLSLQPIIVLNNSLENDTFSQTQEFLVCDPFITNSSINTITAQLQSSKEVLQLSYSSEAITSNRGIDTDQLKTTNNAVTLDADAFISSYISEKLSKKIFDTLVSAQVIDGNKNVDISKLFSLDMYTVLNNISANDDTNIVPEQYQFVLQTLLNHLEASELFTSLSMNANVICVSGQPGSFVLFSANEVFLLSAQSDDKELFPNFSDAVKVGVPLIEPTFAIMKNVGGGDIDFSLSKGIYDDLVQFGIVKEGKVDYSLVTMDKLKFLLSDKVNESQIKCIYNILWNTALVFSNAFVDNNINDAASQKIFEALQNFSILDSLGRIYESNLKGEYVKIALGNLLLDGTVDNLEIIQIYQTLANTPRSLVFSYDNSDIDQNINNYKFTVTRLSTSAVNKLSKALFVNGVDGLLTLQNQQIPTIPVLPLDRFSPSSNIILPKALDATQVDFDGLYGQYFWEIFYHIPNLVSESLKTNLQYSESITWLQYIFNPTIAEDYLTAEVIVDETNLKISLQQAQGIISELNTHTIGDPAKPILSSIGEVNPNFTSSTSLDFLKQSDPSLSDEQILMIRNILLNYELSSSASHFWQFQPFRNHTLQSLKEILSKDNPAIQVYNDDPFDPFAIARLRIGAFEKSILMNYIDTLIAWADQLFTQDTWETITSAYILYIYAYDLLGPKPEMIGDSDSKIVLTFNEIKEKYPDGIPQFLIELEHFVGDYSGVTISASDHAFNALSAYFCVPENSELIKRWDLVEDRMYKINHSENIKGIYRELNLFEPPINPLDLIKAALSGNGIQSVVESKPLLINYKYLSSIGSAHNICNTLIELGNTLLSLLEKSDAEGLSLLRQTQEEQVLNMMTQIKEDRIDELDYSLQSLQSNLEDANNRLDYYTDLIKTGLSGYELSSLEASAAALAFNILGSVTKTAASVGYAVPQVGSPFAMTYGGKQIGAALDAASGVFEIGAQISNFISQNTATMAGYERRDQEWNLQKDTAQSNVDGVTAQIEALQKQSDSAKQDLKIHQKQISQNKELTDYLTQKFTNQDLYQWMIGQISSIYFQTYNLALEFAKQAEASYQFERNSNNTFLNFNYWDNLHKGLTSGNALKLALNQMDMSYRKTDIRGLEIKKNISLAMLAPEEFLKLKTTGRCNINLDESLFDYDYPGHYARQIKTISLTIPAIVGPYVDIKATLTQTKNSIVTKPSKDAVSYLLDPQGSSEIPADIRENWGANQSIAISTGVNDNGMFTLNFNDEKYLPFENTGAVSQWTFSMPLDTNQFDYESISDLLINISYTASYDSTLEKDVRGLLANTPLQNGLFVDASMMSTWDLFLINHSNKDEQTLSLEVKPNSLNYFKSVTYKEIYIQLTTADGINLTNNSTFLSLQMGDEPVQRLTLSNNIALLNGLNVDAKKVSPSWNVIFNLTDETIKPLLIDSFIDKTKLLNVELIAVYDIKNF